MGYCLTNAQKRAMKSSVTVAILLNTGWHTLSAYLRIWGCVPAGYIYLKHILHISSPGNVDPNMSNAVGSEQQLFQYHEQCTALVQVVSSCSLSNALSKNWRPICLLEGLWCKICLETLQKIANQGTADFAQN